MAEKKQVQNSKKAGSEVKLNSCDDKNCPIHSNVRLRGRSFVGTVSSDKMSKTVVVTWARRFFVPKFERYERRVSKLNAHNPACIDAKKGDIVKITETRPLSKTKNFTVVEVIGKASAKDHIKLETIEEENERENVARRKEPVAEE